MRLYSTYQDMKGRSKFLSVFSGVGGSRLCGILLASSGSRHRCVHRPRRSLRLHGRSCMVISRCSFCGHVIPDLLHALWQCRAHSATPVPPRDELERQLCWPFAGASEDERSRARDLLGHGAIVRQTLLDKRSSG